MFSYRHSRFTFLSKEQDDRAEICFYKEYSDRAEYGLSFQGKKIPCGNKDQARNGHFA